MPEDTRKTCAFLPCEDTEVCSFGGECILKRFGTSVGPTDTLVWADA